MRAEELIVEIYRQRSLLIAEGSEPRTVVMSARHYRMIRDYHADLGALEGTASDYLGRHRIFDLEIAIGTVPSPVVRPDGGAAE